MKKYTVMAMALIIAGGFSGAASALTMIVGVPVEVYADPGDVVVELSTVGPCGSRYFHVQRASVNFNELTALAITAFSTGKRLRLQVSHCSGDRNMVSHGSLL